MSIRRHKTNSETFIIACGVLIFFILGFAQELLAQSKLHTAPVIIQGKKIAPVTRYPIESYRVYRTDSQGKALSIPFQIDEVNDDGDYVLDQGSAVLAASGNGLFDFQDELSLMGDDVGPLVAPTLWPEGRPNVVYEVKVSHPGTNPMGPNVGAVYVGVFFSSPPSFSSKKYVVFNRTDALVHTSRYKYQFDNRNWLVAKSIEIAKQEQNPSDYEKVLDSTTFYMKGDLKYFITLEVNHRSIDSSLEAWKSGPIRSLVRVSFFYRVLRLKVELNMYTEISFFSNAIYLPAIMYNPIDGRKSLNPGSGMYYGLALKDNPSQYAIDSNMNSYDPSSGGFIDAGKGLLSKVLPGEDTNTKEKLYWISAQGLGRSIYLEISPSADLIKNGVAPTFYRENRAASEIVSRDNDKARPLGKSPVNLAVAFDATKFSEGEHIMGFRLFFENVMAPERLAVFKTLGDWQFQAKRQNAKVEVPAPPIDSAKPAISPGISPSISPSTNPKSSEFNTNDLKPALKPERGKPK